MCGIIVDGAIMEDASLTITLKRITATVEFYVKGNFT